jgi:hypothetical protein
LKGKRLNKKIVFAALHSAKAFVANVRKPKAPMGKAQPNVKVVNFFFYDCTEAK